MICDKINENAADFAHLAKSRLYERITTMTKEEFARMAEEECSSAATAAHLGGVKGRPFWNAEAFQFMYVPAFQFQAIPGAKQYRYVAKDANGTEHIFEAEKASASLEPIWKDIPEGVVTLSVFALDEEGNKTWQAGCRTFYRVAPFPADLAPAARGYREAAEMVFEYALSKKFMTHWITDGTPEPDYDHYVYPSKMISSIITAMVDYADLCPEKAETALTIARNSADYLIGITAKDGAMAGIPPTYQIDFRPEPETRNNLHAAKRLDWVMMIYPARVGTSYLQLEKKTGDKKYFDAALRIGEFFRDHVEENGGWYLIRSITTGEVLKSEFSDPLRMIAPFLMGLYARTGDESWKILAENGIASMVKTNLKTYSWGAQFEDSSVSANYSNLSHYSATALIRHYCKYYSDDEKKMAQVDDLMRFVEDQFVIWKHPSPWNKSGFDTTLWHTPCGLEQYHWHVPIDASTADIALTFLAMYRAGRGELHLEKAKALADTLTRAQQENGLIPTHWMDEKYMKGKGMWINCLFSSANALREIADFLDL